MILVNLPKNLNLCMLISHETQSLYFPSDSHQGQMQVNTKG